MQIKYIFILLGLFLISCKNEKTSVIVPTVTEEQKKVRVPEFRGDSAYAYIKKQVDFGPRVPGTEEHKACKDWMVGKFKAAGAEVIEQDFDAKIYTGDVWASTNVIAQFKPKLKNRIILAAHWDSRMVAEEDKNQKKRDQPILGADDGASGVGVLIEIARLLGENPIDMGVDIILFDAEDQGQRGATGANDSWGLGAQYWSRNIHTSNYKPRFGILLDMVGAKNPRFGIEGVSKQYAPKIQQKVWKLAQGMGHSDKFVMDETGRVTDDHYFVNVIAGIPMIDIINQPPNSNSGFGPHWHTHGDDIDIIDKNTIQAVGQVVTATVYKTYNGSL